MLTEEDFRDQYASSVQAELIGTQEPYHVSYFIELVRLAFLRDNALILFCRPRTIESVTQQDFEREITVRSSTDTVTRLAEDLLSSGTLRYTQLHIIPTLFGALSIHSLVIRCRQPVSSQLAENRARLCMLALSELSKLWPAAGWILRVFDKVLRRLTGRNRCVECSAPGGKPCGGQPQQPAGSIDRLSDQATLRSGEGTCSMAGSGLDGLLGPTLHGSRASMSGTVSQIVDSNEGIMLEDRWAQELDFDAFENIFQDSLTDAFAPYGTGLDWHLNNEHLTD
ncbi:hypothetical protein LTR84_005602 [Exophiala bonariae]|uniref:Transcription factor domain-containing protein n=1 Tax=Exophiala bonariae TaxID=1690606 RepID=A0AAV9N2T9_9EURO|nr:hypothetical protein LTR84_005602 [Exophiala bonariae]